MLRCERTPCSPAQVRVQVYYLSLAYLSLRLERCRVTDADRNVIRHFISALYCHRWRGWTIFVRRRKSLPKLSPVARILSKRTEIPRTTRERRQGSLARRGGSNETVFFEKCPPSHGPWTLCSSESRAAVTPWCCASLLTNGAKLSHMRIPLLSKSVESDGFITNAKQT